MTPRTLNGTTYLTVPEIAARFGRSRFAARQWVIKGYFPNALDFGEYYRPRWLVPVSDVEAFSPPGDEPGKAGWSGRDKR